jgi:two-component system, OmpR family, sensor kinase
VNPWAIWELGSWATVPFHFIWIGLALMYGWRVWSLRATVAALAVVVVLTGVLLGADVAAGLQEPEELTEIPLMSAVFGAMVLYVQRGARVQRETERVSEHNRVLLEQNRRLVQNASHNLRTPLTIALGFAEVLQRTTSDPRAAQDAQEVIDELNRLKKATDRLLKLAKSDQPDFLFRTDASVAALLEEVTSRWARTGALVEVGQLDDAALMLDQDRIIEVLDELISNAVEHGGPDAHVRVSSRREEPWVVVSVSDDGRGIPEELVPTMFDRFARLAGDDHDGFGLGLAIVEAIVDAHGGTVELAGPAGDGGATVEVRLPLEDAPVGRDSGRASIQFASTAVVRPDAEVPTDRTRAHNLR